MKEVVITGIGLRSSIANDFESFVEGSFQGKIGVSKDDAKDFSEKTRVFGFLKDVPIYEPTNNINPKVLSNVSHLALHCAKEAFSMARIENFSYNRRWGVCLGSGFNNVYDLYPSMLQFIEQGQKKASPMSVPKLMGHAPSVNIALEFLLGGVATMNSDACVAGMTAMKQAFDLIAHGEQDLVVSGGLDLSSNPFIVSAWETLRALSSLNNPEEASNPFHVNRDGFVLGEGACFMILESKESAQKRGAKMLAKVESIYQGSSAFDVVKTHSETEEHCIRKACELAGISLSDVGIAFCHATGTKLSSVSEFGAFKNILGRDVGKLYCYANKSALGHTIGASGPFSVAAALGSFHHGYYYPMPHLNSQNIADDFKELYYSQSPLKKEAPRYAIVNAFAFGGINTSCILSKVD